MKKESIFDLWADQNKEVPKREPERIENEVRPADLEEKKEVTKATEPEPEPEPEEAPAATPEEGLKDGIS